MVGLWYNGHKKKWQNDAAMRLIQIEKSHNFAQLSRFFTSIQHQTRIMKRKTNNLETNDNNLMYM